MKNRQPLLQITRLLLATILATAWAISVNAQTQTVSGGVLNGKAVNLVKPLYPPSARAIKAAGAVNVQVTIDETGKVISASAVSGHPLLRSSAEMAARASTFKPTYLSGNAVKLTGIITYFISPYGSDTTSSTNNDKEEGSKESSTVTEEETVATSKRTSNDAQTSEGIAEYEVGDTVEVYYAGRWNPGVIVEVEGSGKSVFAEVNYTFQGDKRNAKFFYNALRHAAASSTPNKKNTSPSSGDGLTLGEYGCSSKVWSGGRWAFTPRGSFTLLANGKYTQTNGGGSYKNNAAAKEITFTGGFFGNSDAKGKVISNEQIDIQFEESYWWTCALQK